VLYEVRLAGRSVRLYTNGVLHSQYNPQHPVAGGLWDLLSLPALFLPTTVAPRVLVLGVGGGAVIRQLSILLDRPHITGIDIDRMHVQIARQWFGVSSDMAVLIEADAITWVKRYRGKGFDLVVDDLFGENEGEPVRAVELDQSWSAALTRLLRPEGVIVINTLECRALRARGFLPQMSGRYRCQLPQYENCIGVFTANGSTQKTWRQRLQQHARLTSRQKRLALATRFRRL